MFSRMPRLTPSHFVPAQPTSHRMLSAARWSLSARSWSQTLLKFPGTALARCAEFFHAAVHKTVNLFVSARWFLSPKLLQQSVDVPSRDLTPVSAPHCSDSQIGVPMQAIPAFLTIAVMPLTYSIAYGVIAGSIWSLVCDACMFGTPAQPDLGEASTSACSCVPARTECCALLFITA